MGGLLFRIFFIVATDTLLRFQDTQLYCAVDFETESLSLLGKNRPWEVAYCIFNNKKILKKESFFILWDDIKVSSDAARITGFNLQKYKSLAQNSLEILNIINNLLYDPKYFIVGTNYLGFDVYVHNIWRKEMGLDSDYSYLERLLDTHCLSIALKLELKEIPKIPKERLAFQYRMSTIKKKGLKTGITAMCKYFGIEYDSSLHHGAEYDTVKSAEIFQKLLWNIDIS